MLIDVNSDWYEDGGCSLWYNRGSNADGLMLYGESSS